MSAQCNDFGNICDDCIAVCAPGIVLSIPLFYERVLLRPYGNPDKVSDIRIESDQLYDMLLQPETGAVERLLFVSPSILFDVSNPAQSIHKYIQVESIMAGDSWHYPIAPELSAENQVKVTIHDPQIEPARPAFENLHGELGTATLTLPEALQNPESFAAMVGLKRTVFECILKPPINVGEKRWLRLRIKPPKIFPPGKLSSEHNAATGLSEQHSQIFDLLGSDALLESFRDTLQNSLKAEVFGKEMAADTGDERFTTAINDLLVFTFKDGFERPGTYTLISDHRITLTSENVEIQMVTTEGCISFGTIAMVNSLMQPGYHWNGGLRFFSMYDPLVAAENIYEYVHEYASKPETSKSKEDCTYAAEVYHPLGCALIDIFAAAPWQYIRSNDNGKTFYIDPEKRLPEDEQSRYLELVKIAAQVVKKIRPAKAHFRIFFRGRWTQLAEEHKKLVSDEAHQKTTHLILAWSGVVLGLLALIVAIIALL